MFDQVPEMVNARAYNEDYGSNSTQNMLPSCNLPQVPHKIRLEGKISKRE